MKAIAVFLLFLALVVTANSYKGRVTGGVEAIPNEFPWIVHIGKTCAGSIVNNRWLVTAATCVSGPPSSLTIVAGDHNERITERTEQLRNAIRVHKHPDLSYANMTRINNIALVEVDIPFEFKTFVQPAKFPEVGFTPTSVATVAGWFASYNGGLRKVDVPHVDDETCNQTHSGAVDDSMICYGGERGKDACGTDQGGPLMCGSDKVLCGIISVEISNCPRHLPTRYSEVSHFVEWIKGLTTYMEEDKKPITQVQSCGGYVEASSGTIRYKTGTNIRANKTCLWFIKSPYDSIRFSLTKSSLNPSDGIFLSPIHRDHGTPGTPTRIDRVGANYMISEGLVIVALSITPGKSNRQFTLQFFSSGFVEPAPPTGHAYLNSASDNFSYPSSGNYSNLEKAFFVLNPQGGGNRTVTFNALDIPDREPDYLSCVLDPVSVYAWVNSTFHLLATICRTELPEPFLFPEGAGLITFFTNAFTTGKGFSFKWE